MQLPTLIEALDATDLTRMVQSSKSGYGEIVTYYNATRTQLDCTINSTVYENVTNLCFIVKDNVTYLYVTCNYQRYYTKVAISTINSISISSSS